LLEPRLFERDRLLLLLLRELRGIFRFLLFEGETHRKINALRRRLFLRIGEGSPASGGRRNSSP
jgi:hypothetical protein